MPDILLSQPMYMLVSLVLSVVVTGAMIGGTLLFEQQRSRLDPGLCSSLNFEGPWGFP